MAGNQQQGWTEDTAFNWDDISDEPPPQLEAGIYHAKVAKAEAEPTSTGLPCVQMEITVVGRLDGGSVEGSAVKLRYESIAFTKDAAFRAKQFANAAGCPLPKSSGFGVLEAWAKEIVGLDVIVRLKPGPPSKTTGRVFTRVDRYLTAEQAAEAAAAGQMPADAAPPQRKRRTR